MLVKLENVERMTLRLNFKKTKLIPNFSYMRSSLIDLPLRIDECITYSFSNIFTNIQFTNLGIFHRDSQNVFQVIDSMILWTHPQSLRWISSIIFICCRNL